MVKIEFIYYIYILCRTLKKTNLKQDLCSFPLKDQPMMRLTSSSWGTCLDNHTYSRQMSILKEKGVGNNNSIYGLIPQQTSTPTQSYGAFER